MKIIDRKDLMVVHSNVLTEARYHLTTGEQKVVLLMTAMISKNDKDFKDYEIRVSDFVRIMEINSKNVYGRLKETLERLASRTLYIPRERGFLVIGWISSAEYIEGKGVIQLSFDKKLKPYLLQLKNRFTKYGLVIATQFKSSHTIRIYMLLKQYENVGFREFELLELRNILDIKKHEYKRFADFRKRIINQAKREFDKKDKETELYLSDINFNLETIKTGRKITRLRFIIIKQETKHYIEINPNENNEDNANNVQSNDDKKPTEKPINQTLKTLIRFGITKEKALEFQNKYGDDYLKEKVDYTLEQNKSGKIKSSLSGFLITAIEKNYKTEATLKAEQKKAEETQRKQEESSKKQLKKARESAIQSYIDQQNDEQKEALKFDFEQSDIFRHQMHNDRYIHSVYIMMETFDEVLAHKDIRPTLKSFIFYERLQHLNHLKNLEAWKQHHNLN